MKYEITVCLFQKDEICSIDDKMVTHTEIELEKEKAIECMNEIAKVLEKYKGLLNGDKN